MIGASADGRLGPIFIGGAARSGKTLLRWLLSSHPRIAVSRRTEMWPRFSGRYGDLGRSENLERCLRAMLARKQVAALEPDLDRLRKDFLGGAPTYARLFALIHEQYAERSGKPRWGDQTGLIERFADELMTAYPGARLIQMVRDPRDRYVAVRDRATRRPGALGRAMSEWLSSVGLAHRNAERHPGSCTIVRYEDLATRPEETIRELCAFLRETFEPKMLRMEGVRRYDPERARTRDGSPISTAHVGTYRGEIDRSEIAFIQAVAGRAMRGLGYRMDPIRLSPAERFRYVTVGWPTNLTRLGPRRALSILHAGPGSAGLAEGSSR
jgi:hypothetical protein